MKLLVVTVASALVAVLPQTPALADGTSDGPPAAVVGNATGGGWVEGEVPDYPANHDAVVAAKRKTWYAYDAMLKGEMSEAEFREIERAASLVVGETMYATPASMAPEATAPEVSPAVQGLAALAPAPCGGDNPCPTEKKLLNVDHRAQNNNYYCGPATGVMIANYRGKQNSAYNGVALNQGNMAGPNHMQTDLLGKTPYSSNNFTEGLNRWLKGTTTGYYAQVDNPSTNEFRVALRYDIEDNHPFGVSTVEWQGETSYNGHNTSNDDIGHWIVARGYSDFVDRAHFHDPASSVWSSTNPSFSKPTNSFVTTYVDNGISA